VPDRTPQKKINEAETPESFAEPDSLELVEDEASAAANQESENANALTVRGDEHASGETEVLPPETVIDGKYKISSCLGKGGTGVIYKVVHLTKNKEFALKILAGEFSESQLQRFQAYAKAASLLDHPNLAKVMDFGIQANKQPYFVMEFVEGITLKDYLKRCGRLTYDDIFAVFLPLCWALQDAHEKGVIHRNVKPSNMMLIGEQGSFQCKLLDFGLGKVGERNRKAHNMDDSDIDNFMYMSPEQCSGKKTDIRSDIYSLGCALFEAITARPPFRGRTAQETIDQHLNVKPPTLKEASLGRDFPVELESIVQTMLSKDPQQRFSSGSQVAENLMRLKLSQQLRIKTKAQPKSKEISQDRLIIGLGLATALATGLAFFFWLQLNKPTDDEHGRTPDSFASAPGFGQMKYFPPEVRVIESDRIGEPIELAQDLSTTPFLYKVEHIDGNELRHYKFPDRLGGILTDRYYTSHSTRGIQTILWTGPMTFSPNYEALRKFPRLFKRFKDDEIRSVTIKQSQISQEAVKDLTTYKNLDELIFDNTDLNNAGLKLLETVPTLTSLHLLSTNVGPSAVAHFPRLQLLHKLSLGEILDAGLVLNALRNSRALEELKLKNCRNLTARDYQLIAALPNLKKFTIQDYQGIDTRLFDQLAKSRSLRELNIENPDITDEVIRSLGKLKRLQVLVLFERNITLQQKNSLKKLLPLCDIRYQADRFNSTARVIR